MRRLLPLLLSASIGLAAEREIAVVRLDEVESAVSVPRVPFPRAVFALRIERPDGLDPVPPLSKQARYARVALEGRNLLLAFDAPEGAPALGLLYTGGTEAARGRARPQGRGGFQVEFDKVDCGGLVCDVRLTYRGTKLEGGALQPTYHRRGRVALAGSMREVFLMDADGDGRYDGGRDRWIALRDRRVARVRTLHRTAALLLGEPQVPFEADGRALSVEGVRPDGSRLTLVLDQPRMSLERVLARRYAETRAEHFAAFESERQEFADRNELDASRPTVAEPAAWKQVNLTDAKLEGLRTGKPVLALFFTESNPWSYRFEFYTFPDKEVDALLRRFVLVRIDAEKDPERSYQTCGVRGLPALLPLTADGLTVKFKLRTRTLHGNVTELAEPEQMITGWQRPQELVVNLKRILDAVDD
jgi:hypothetical protein